MTGTAGALAYLIVRTTRNRVAKQVSRVRNPRYAVALLFGVGYFYLVFLRPGGSSPRTGASVLTAMPAALLSAMLFLTITVTWLFNRTSGALAFLPAEVQFLFPAPVSRRQLLGYRMVRSQLVLLLNAVIWSVLLQRFGLTRPAPFRFAMAWAVFSVLSLHQLGAALVMVPQADGPRRLAAWTVKAIALVALAAVVIGLIPAFNALNGLGLRAALDLVVKAIASPPISWVLFPFQLLIAPIMAPTPGAWLMAFAVVLAIIALHVAWVLAMRVEFTDVAVTASAKRAARIAAMKAARGGDPVTPKAGKAARHWLPLAPLGPPAIAIAWKNTIALFRGGGVRTVVMVVLIGFFIVMSRSMGSGEPAERGVAALPFLGLVVTTLMMGPRLLRNDLRQDMLRLATLKTYPLKGSRLVAAETLSPTLVLTAFQVLMLVIGYATIPDAAKSLEQTSVSPVFVVIVPFALLALNGVNVVIQNGIVLLFPSWVRLGADSGGVEAMGQNLLVTFGSMFALLLAMLLPVGACVAMVAFVRFTAGPATMTGGLAAGAVVGVLLLAGEIAAMVAVFGRSFERIDPTTIT